MLNKGCLFLMFLDKSKAVYSVDAVGNSNVSHGPVLWKKSWLSSCLIKDIERRLSTTTALGPRSQFTLSPFNSRHAVLPRTATPSQLHQARPNVKKDDEISLEYSSPTGSRGDNVDSLEEPEIGKASVHLEKRALAKSWRCASRRNTEKQLFWCCLHAWCPSVWLLDICTDVSCLSGDTCWMFLSAASLLKYIFYLPMSLTSFLSQEKTLQNVMYGTVMN